MNYTGMIEVLEKVKALRLSGLDHSPYVCDNIRFNLRDELGGFPKLSVIEYIAEYIDHEHFFEDWYNRKHGTGYETRDPVIAGARMAMIDTLIAKFSVEAQRETV